MAVSDDLKNAREGVALVGDIIKAAGENPNVKEAGENLGKSALTISKTINNVLLPLAAVNFAFEKAQVYFSERFQSEMSEKTSNIPEENIVEPKASIAGPALQGLAFTHEEETLKDMYLSLLATAMNSETLDKAHPAFVEIIRQLTSEEAHLLQALLKIKSSQPICEVRLQEKGQQTWKTLTKHLINITNTKNDNPVENEQYPSMIENWIRLGLVEVNYSQFLSDKKLYSWIEDRPEVKKLRREHQNDKFTIIFQRGVIEPTAFGYQFAKAVEIEE